MADNPTQELQTLILERDDIARKIDAISRGGEPSTAQQENLTKSIDDSSYLAEIDRLRQLLQQIEDRIRSLENQNAAAVVTDPAEPPLDLIQRYGVHIAMARTALPWLLPVNALVVSVGVQGGMQGGLSQAMRDHLGEEVWQSLRGVVQSAISAIEPETPVLIPLPPDLGRTVLPNAPELPDGNENGRYQLIAATPARPHSDDLDPGAAAKAIVKLAVNSGIRHLAVPLLGSGRAGLESAATAEEMFTAIYWAIPEGTIPEGAIPESGSALTRITLTTRPTADDDKSDVLKAVRTASALLAANRAQPLSADIAEGEDTLGIKTEVYALAETLLLRDVETPLAVGILGGWGSGKSFVMHLMQKEMQRIRSLKVTKAWIADETEPYVGHVYPISFNAWTYAKSDLWASLMQTIFMELNRQLSLEQLFTRERLLAGGANWLELNQLGEKERLALLQSELGRETVAAWRRGETPDSLLQAYHEMRSAEVKEMETAVQELDEKQNELASLVDTFAVAQETIPEAARREVWAEILKTAVFSPIATEIQDTLTSQTYTTADGKVVKVFSDEDLQDLTKLTIKLKQFRPTMTSMWHGDNLKKSLQEKRWSLVTAVILILAAVFSAFIADRLDQFSQSATVTSVTAFLAAVSSIGMAAFRTYQEWSDTVQRWSSGIQDVENLAQEMLSTKETQILTAVEKEFSQQKQALEQEISDLNAQIDTHRQRMGAAGIFTSLSEFVSSRLEMGDYAERLGMLHRAQADLQELTDTLTVYGDQDLYAAAKQSFFPRGPARVVLFIDDLDRCPPPKVVEVLEAVQLLLRTKLFVIVLGLDTRYVTRALEKEYDRILTRDGDPSGLDYIEKIIQIPYRVRPIEPTSLHTFLAAQMEMAAAPGEGETAVTPTPSLAPTSPSPGGNGQKPDGVVTATGSGSPVVAETILPQRIKFHHEDFTDLEQSCVIIGLTPRSIKRLINVLKLIKVFWFRTNQYKKPQEVRTVINLLALSARYPEIMAQSFANIEAAFRNGADEPLSAFLVRLPAAPPVLVQHDAFETAVAALNLADITLKELGLETFHLVRSFSFVGDPAYDQ
ncbi:MAG: P-loop NTPase fold protein [Chloroflexota bacterium]